MTLENRAIAFIDILGFKDLMERMNSNPEIVTTIHQILKGILLQEQSVYEDMPRALLKGTLEMTSFSDCVVISDLHKNFFSVMVSARALYLNLLRHGILSRGAITVGDVFHKGRIVFGEGLVAAYKLELSGAVYPRIIVPDEFRTHLDQSDASHGYNIKFAHTLAQDSDGLWYIQPFGYPRVLPKEKTSEDRTREYFNQFRKHLMNGLQRFEREGNIPVLAKYRWLARRFNESLEAEGIDIPHLLA